MSRSVPISIVNEAFQLIVERGASAEDVEVVGVGRKAGIPWVKLAAPIDGKRCELLHAPDELP